MDPTGKANGRGAYVCSDRDHWGERGTVARLSQALQVQITADAAEQLARDWKQAGSPASA
jgi:predicted RNA-binding protein YlxR (DUF448 family)